MSKTRASRPASLGARGERLEGVPVQAVDRNAALPTRRSVVDRHHVLGLAANAVLGAEEGREREPWCLSEEIGQVPEARVDTGGVDDGAHPLASELSDAEADRHFFFPPSSNSMTGSTFFSWYWASLREK